MEGITRTAAVRLAELDRLQRAHPEFDFDEFAGNYYAWKPAPGDGLSGEASHGRTADELLRKLARHSFEQVPGAAWRVCLACGRWPLHHVHTGNRPGCTCDECNQGA